MNEHESAIMDSALDTTRTLFRTLELNAANAQAWSVRGGLLREAHRLQEAAACFQKILACCEDPELNTYYLNAVRQTANPPAPLRRYVEGMFNAYAQDFQDHLVEHLRYQGHERLLRPLAESGRRFQRALDLGCGTGLCAPLLQSMAESIDGVDISQAMLAQARKLGLYRDLTHADIGAYLESETSAADLIAAADVFIYVGELDAIFRSVRRILAPQGCFAFTAELCEEENVRLLPILRYAHSEAYLRETAARHGLQVERIDRASLRLDQAQPIEGLYVYLR